ncbi:hypothetical protein HK097_000690, partial [Rhizophlyctis rosea]
MLLRSRTHANSNLSDPCSTAALERTLRKVSVDEQMQEALNDVDEDMLADEAEETVEVDDLGIGDVTGQVVKRREPDAGKPSTFPIITKLADSRVFDPASDYYPSDDELSKSTEYRLKRRKICLERAESVYNSLTKYYGTQPMFWLAQMAKFKQGDDGSWRWSGKGPVMVHINPQRPNHLVAHYLYGMKSVALNICVPEVWTHFFENDHQNSVIFSTCNSNFVTEIMSQCQVVPLENEIPAQYWMNRTDAGKFLQTNIGKWEHRTTLRRDGEGGLWMLRFK